MHEPSNRYDRYKQYRISDAGTLTELPKNPEHFCNFVWIVGGHDQAKRSLYYQFRCILNKWKSTSTHSLLNGATYGLG